VDPEALVVQQVLSALEVHLCPRYLLNLSDLADPQGLVHLMYRRFLVDLVIQSVLSIQYHLSELIVQMSLYLRPTAQSDCQ